MRTALLCVATGLVSGVVGAVSVGRFKSPPASPTAVTVQPPASPAGPLILPPGWDPSLFQRVDSIEEQLKAERTERLARRGAELPQDELDLESIQVEHQQERLEQYQKELASSARALDDHNREIVDVNWARAQESRFSATLSSLELPAQLKRADCRNTTCAVTLTYLTPTLALSSLANDGRQMAVPGCRGFIATPAPPLGAGPYDLTVLYNCR
jgi:hypothetical protein